MRGFSEVEESFSGQNSISTIGRKAVELFRNRTFDTLGLESNANVDDHELIEYPLIIIGE